jgi:hypothetical protein
MCSNEYELEKEYQHRAGLDCFSWGPEQNEWNVEQEKDPFWVLKND